MTSTSTSCSTRCSRTATPRAWCGCASASAATGCTRRRTRAAGDRRGAHPAPRRGPQLPESGRHARGRRADSVLAARTNYFREEYAYGTRSLIEGIEPFLLPRRLRRGRPADPRPAVIEPAIVFANLMVPGQELAVHTDVPEFRGANRKLHPQWLLVAMHHSGLFEDWRMPIATGVAWFHDCDGGEFAFYPDGADGPPVPRTRSRTTPRVAARHRHACSTASTASRPTTRPTCRRSSRACSSRFDGDGRWSVRDGDTAVAELRRGTSCASRSRGRRTASPTRPSATPGATHTDDLSLDATLATLVEDLRSRGRITGDTAAVARARADDHRRVHPLPPVGGRVAGERRGVCRLAKPGISRACSRKC